MHCTPSHPWSLVGIQSVAVREDRPVSRVDLMTRDPRHAADLQWNFGVRPFRFTRRSETLYAFPRIPAVSARAWMEDHGLTFRLTGAGLDRRDLATWVQAGS